MSRESTRAPQDRYTEVLGIERNRCQVHRGLGCSLRGIMKQTPGHTPKRPALTPGNMEKIEMADSPILAIKEHDS